MAAFQEPDRAASLHPYEPTVKEPSRAQEKAAADAESPKAADVPRMPENMPRVEKNGQLCLFRAEFAEFLQKVGKKAKKWRFMQKILTKRYKMYDFPHFLRRKQKIRSFLLETIA